MALPSLRELLPKGYPARSIVEVVEGPELSGKAEADSGCSKTYHPTLLLSPILELRQFLTRDLVNVQ